jgi:uncharacterized membrane protein YphA (DoxX/SURF4 family)
MLDDQERNTLRELERQLSLEDPGFVDTFARRQERLSAGPRGWPGAAIVVVVTLVLSGLMLLFGSAAGAFAVLLTAVMVWLVWHFSGDLDPHSLP